MKKSTFTLGSLLAVATLSLGFTHAAVLQDAIQWGYDQGLTSFNTSTAFRPNDTLRRDEAAKFLVEFAKLQKSTTNLNYNLNCDFKDINKSRSDLKSYVNTACQMEILKGNAGNVNPDQKLTNAQAVTVVVRIVDGYQSESWVAHRADNYYKRAMVLGLDISKFWDKNAATTRGNVMMLLYNAYNGGDGVTGNGSVDDILQQIVDILEE